MKETEIILYRMRYWILGVALGSLCVAVFGWTDVRVTVIMVLAVFVWERWARR